MVGYVSGLAMGWWSNDSSWVHDTSGSIQLCRVLSNYLMGIQIGSLSVDTTGQANA